MRIRNGFRGIFGVGIIILLATVLLLLTLFRPGKDSIQTDTGIVQAPVQIPASLVAQIKANGTARPIPAKFQTQPIGRTVPNPQPASPVSNTATVRNQQLITGIQEALDQTANNPGTGFGGLPRGTGSRVPNPRQQQAIDQMLQELGDEAQLHMDNVLGTVRFLEGDLNRLVQNSEAFQQARQKMDYPAMSVALADEIKRVMNLLDPSKELVLDEIIEGDNGMVHVRMNQTYKGIPIWGAQVGFHYTSDQKPIRIAGVYAGTPARMPIAQNPVSKERALQTAMQALKMTDQGITTPSVEDMIYWDLNRAPIDSYQIKLTPSLHEHWLVFVSRAGGTIVHQSQAICSQAMTGTAVDLFGETRTVYSWLDNGNHYLIDTHLPFYDTSSTPPNINGIRGALIILDAKNQIIDDRAKYETVISSNPSQWDPTAVSVQYNFNLVEDYYRRTFQRTSIDNKGMNIVAIIHGRFSDGQGGSYADNAFWNPGAQIMVFGDGDRTFHQLPKALDVTGHELTHGVINHTSDLIYENQSGALNEHLADFFGCMIDRDDWLQGEDVVPGKDALRDMKDPTNPNLGSRQPGHMNDYEYLPNTPQGDNGGVHVNSGIPNKMSYLLAEGPQGVGKEKAE